jgi:hypothetical protein
MFTTSELNVTTNVGTMQWGHNRGLGKRQGTLRFEKNREFMELD